MRSQFLCLVLLALLANVSALSTHCDCGLSFANRVFSGRTSATHAYPWLGHVRVMLGDAYRQCNGVLLDAQSVLTAGHCFCDANGIQFDRVNADVVFGNFNKSSPFGQGVRVRDIITSHECGTLNHDWAIVKTDRVRYAAEVSPVCVPAINEPSAGPYVVAGRGLVDNGHKTDVVKERFVKVSKCQSHPPMGAICGEAWDNTGSVTCSGDDGAPVMYRGADGRHYLRAFAVGSSGRSCGLGSNDYFVPIETVRKHIAENTNACIL